MRIYRPCPKCHSENTRVTTTDQKSDTEIKRYMRCLDCKFRFRSIEVVTDESTPPGKPKGSFILDDHQVAQIGYNDPYITLANWAAIYNVSTTTIRHAKQRFEKYRGN